MGPAWHKAIERIPLQNGQKKRAKKEEEKKKIVRMGMESAPRDREKGKTRKKHFPKRDLE